MKSLGILLFLAPFLVSGNDADQTVNQVGLWNVTTCIKANFSMNFTFVLKNYEKQPKINVFVPKDAEVDDLASKCGDGNQDQILSLKWTDEDPNNATELERSVTISFKKNVTQGLYGVSHLYGTFQMAKWEVNVTDDQGNTTKVDYNSTVTVDSNEIENIMFHTPLGMSFTCKDIGDFSLVTKIHYMPSKYMIDLENATIETGHLHFDAFRPTTLAPEVWRVPMDCEFKYNDDDGNGIYYLIGSLVTLAVGGICIVAFCIWVVKCRNTTVQEDDDDAQLSENA